MACKCRICGSNEVDYEGDVCELCAIGQDPYASGMSSAAQPQPQPKGNGGYAQQQPEASHTGRRGASRKVLIGGGSSNANLDPYGNDMTVSQQPAVQVYQAGQMPAQMMNQQPAVQTGNAPAAKAGAHGPLTEGITKNISVDNEEQSFLAKWFRALFTGAPLPLDNEVTMFQVFPDYSGTALTSQGTACDQVIIYGKVGRGAVSENNEVEVYGKRDSHNNIVASKIKNKATGTTVSPQRCIGNTAVWILTILALILVAGAVLGLGVEGLIWAGVIILCLTNLPLVFKIIGGIFGAIFSLLKRLF